MATKLPEFQDDVKHKLQGTTGVVIAKYSWPITEAAPNPKGGYTLQIFDIPVLDVRLGNDTIVYATPAENWETVRTEKERIGI